MLRKLAGHLPLQDMIANTIEGAKLKLAASDGAVFKPMDPKKDIRDEKKRKEMEEKEKKSSALGFDIHDLGEMSKLASALDMVGEEMLKEADSIENGGESRQGGSGTQLPTMSRVSGTQSYKHDKSRHGNIPLRTGTESSSDGNSGNSTATPTDEKRAPGAGKAYPAKGVFKTASGVRAMIQARKAELLGEDQEKTSTVAGHITEFALKHPHTTAGAIGTTGGAAAGAVSAKKGERLQGAAKGALVGGAVGTGISHGMKHIGERGLADIDAGKHIVKGASADDNGAVDFILNKMAESRQGGESAGEFPSGRGPVPPVDGKGGNDVRRALNSNQAVVDMTKAQAKAPQRRMLAEVLDEPALSKSTDTKVHENLRNASKGGVKIAAAKALLSKIAADPNDPRHEKLKEALEKKKDEKEKKSAAAGNNSTEGV